MPVLVKVGEPVDFAATEKFSYSGFVSFKYDPNIVEICRDVKKRKYNPTTKEWEIAGECLAKFLDELELNNIEYHFTEKQDEKMLSESFNDDVDNVEVDIPDGFVFKTEPFEHQLKALKFGLANNSFMLGDEQGLGKTKSIIDLAVCRKLRDGIQHCLIICGINGNKYNWEEEVKLHSNEGAWILGTRYSKMGKPYIGTLKDRLDDLNRIPKQFFWITNVETLRLGAYKQYPKRKSSPYIYPVIDAINKLTKSGIIGMVAFDEAHKAKNPASRQGQALLKINCDSIIPMSGTFVLNNPLDLYIPLRLVGKEDSSYYIYKNRYCILGGFNNSEVIGYRRLSELQDYLKECMLRRKKENVLDLPPKVYKTEYVELGVEQKKLYQEVRENIMTNLSGIKLSPNPLVEMQRLRQVTGYPGTISNTIIESTKMNRLVDIVEECVLNDEKAIVFSLWTSMTEVLREKLKKYNPAYITGEVKDSVRMGEVNKFQNDPTCKVIIGTVGAMGTGLTLTAASNVIFLDEPWNRGLKDQAEDRAHRIGTNGTVTVITLVTKDTIDEGINNLVQKKGKIADLLVDGVGDKITDSMVEYLAEYTG